MGKKLLKDEGKLFARISCTCSAVKTLYVSCNFKTFYTIMYMSTEYTKNTRSCTMT